MAIVFGIRSTTARVMIISLTYNPAPYSRHRVRNGALVTPAIGASTTGGHTRCGPTGSGANSPGRAGPVRCSRLAGTPAHVPAGVLAASALRRRSEEHTSELQSRPHLVCR